MIGIILLSLIQGVTEFLPISSSSHLILISKYLDLNNQSLSIDISLHIGSFFAVIFYFRKEVVNFFENKILFLKILISSVPLMLVGFYLVKSGLIERFRNLEVIAWTTIIFGILLYISDKYKLKKNIKENFSYKSAIIIGFFQIFSLIPGVSRSGIAITAARFLRFKRIDSANVSFLLSIPILGAVSIFGLQNLISTENLYFTKLNFISIILSFLFSLITIRYFLKYINKFSLNVFVYYRISLGLFLLLITYS